MECTLGSLQPDYQGLTRPLTVVVFKCYLEVTRAQRGRQERDFPILLSFSFFCIVFRRI